MEVFPLLKKMTELDAGIIPSDMSLEESFKTLSPEDARATKRKFRKLKRKAVKKYYSDRKIIKPDHKKMRPEFVKSLIRHFLSERTMMKMKE